MQYGHGVKNFGSTPVITPPAGDTLVITESDLTTTTNYPVQIGRFFNSGEIANFPSVKIDGVSQTTQAWPTQRWPNGSVRHCIMSFHIPTMQSGASKTISFENKPNQTSFPLSQAQMLAASFDFDMSIQFNFGTTTQTVSARQMLTDGNYSVWFSGPVATSIQLADHSTSRVYDVGSDVNRSVRVIFDATFWPLTNQVDILACVEITNYENKEYNQLAKQWTSSIGEWFTKSQY